MMLGELSLVINHVGNAAKTEEYVAAILEENILGKPTRTTRQRSAKRLLELYALDRSLPTFRLLLHLWSADVSARPMLAYLAASARDPLLREMTPFIVDMPVNSDLNATQVAKYLQEKYPSRFKPTTLFSTAQNLASSWTQAGYLAGKVKKRRTRPVITPVVVTFALLLGYLCGLRGKMLLGSVWTRMLDRSPVEIADLATEASRQGWLNYKGAGAVVEITFPDMLTSQEERASHDPA